MTVPTAQRRVRRVVVGAVAAALAVAIFVVAWRQARRGGAAPGADRTAVIRESGPAGAPSAAADSSRDGTPRIQELASAGSPIDIPRATEAAAGGAAEARACVRGLWAGLDQLSPQQRRARIMEFFATGRDVRFGAMFTIGPGGYLQEWPTLRVALFDYLAQRDGEAARDTALQWLEARPEEPAEWALAFRELVRGRESLAWPDIVTQRMHEFLRDERWIAGGERGWLEGFDAVAAGRATGYLPDLSALASRRDAGAASFGAFVAADRLMLAAPVETMRVLNGDVMLFATTPELRAGLFARADVRAADQLGALEAYLLREDVAEVERQAFGDLFPLYELAVSNNLLSTSPIRPAADMERHDRAALAVIDRWSRDNRLAGWREVFASARARLEAQLTRLPAE